MEIIEYISKMKEIYSSLQYFIDSNDSIEDEFNLFVKTLEEFNITENQSEVIDLFQLLAIIGNNHCTKEYLFIKIELIIRYIQDETNSKLFNINLFEIFKHSKQLLLFLLSKNIITINGHEEEISELFPDTKDIFEEKFIDGVNDSYICQIIREDLIEEFIQYIHKNGIPLTSRVPSSKYETNPLLKGSNLISYAAYYGSIQIFQYLISKKVYCYQSLWIYAIHSNNAEIVNILEELEIKPNDLTYSKCMLESIKCHHSNVANYIERQYRFVNNESIFNRDIIASIFKYKYYPFYPSDADQLFNSPKSTFGFLISDFNYPIKKLTIPSFVSIIVKGIFNVNSKYEQIAFESPSSLTLIEGFAFKGCKFTFFKELIFFFNNEEGINAFEGCKELEIVSFEQNSFLVSIGINAFKGCLSLKQIIIPSSVKTIDDFCFDGCKSLTVVDFESPSSLSALSSSIFNRCSSLMKIKIPSSIARIGSRAFNECTSLAEISFDQNSSLKIIDSFAFEKCSSLVNISIPNSVVSVGKNVFSKCSLLKEITVPASIEKSNFGIEVNCKVYA